MWKELMQIWIISDIHLLSPALTDVTVGSLTVAPLRYGLIKIDEKRRVFCESASLSILQDEASEFFNLLTIRQAGVELEALSLETEIENEMLDFWYHYLDSHQNADGCFL